jgi:integral membrane protein (TIGR00529 family)
MDFLVNLPASIKVGASFCGILVAYRSGLGLGFAILVFAVVLTLWTGAGLAGCSYQAHSLLSPENYLLLVVILLLLFFTEALDKTGRMKRTINALEEWLKSPRLLLAGFPALVGLLPMPGGALFSAPLVAAVDPENTLRPAHKAAINYWFRHIWEYWWPLYPGIILAIKYSGLSSGLFFCIQMPFTLAAAASGYVFIMRRIGRGQERARPGKLDKSEAASTLWPIAVLVIVSLAGSFLLPSATGMAKTLANIVAMVVGLSIGLVVIFWNNTGALRQSMAMFAKKNTWEMMLLVLGIQVFSGALTVPIPPASALTVPLSHGGAAGTLVMSMRDEFLGLGIPLVFVIALVPFISGAVTGVAFGFVGASFPIVFALLGASPPLNVVCAATTFAYGCGYMGMILSPVHICFVVTNEYFKSRMFETYRYILLPSACIFIAGCIMSASYYYFLH